MLVPKPPSPCFAVSRWVFARALGIAFFFAFGSLAVQVRGLIGSRGVVPVREFLKAARGQLGPAAYWKVPTAFWFCPADFFLVAVCLIGALLSVALMFGFRPRICAVFLWALYLSLASVGSPFLDFQWDGLLLETGFLAIFFLPFGRRPNWRGVTHLSRIAHCLLWWLLFRLMFESGVVKLTSGDAAWRSLGALDFHFETQPLPVWTAWYVNQMPHWLLAFGALLMFAVELLAPWLIVAPARFRHLGAWALIALQVCILLTGNYAFFNLLTIALCLLLFEDSAWPEKWRKRLRLGATFAARRRPAWIFPVAIPVACVIALLTALPLASSLGLSPRSLTWLYSASEAIAPLRSFNGYGLFAVMTTTRHEIVIEGSNDGAVWREYEFPRKPGDLGVRPKLVAPCQPRLDWQMWFAALGGAEQNPWFVRLLQRLLEGSPEVIGLLERNPFPDHPPAIIRAVIYDYHFTRFGDPGPTWWKREPLGLYYPAVSLKKDD